METDTSEIFAEVFGNKTGFDSWDEFTTYLEEFQRKSGSAFKLKSASHVDYINEKRVTDQIPDRFVYAKVKIICVHFGLPVIRGEGHRKSYMGKGCGAFISVGYNKGALRINQTHLVHVNHPLGQEDERLPVRSFRVFNFTDELDLIMAREIQKNNPFEYVNGEKKWVQALDNLKSDDDRFANITARLVKKRIRTLIDKFLAYSNGKTPHEQDEMGCILYELDKSRKETLDKSKQGKTPSRKRSRPSYNEDDVEEDYEDDEDDEDFTPVASRSTPQSNSTGKRGRPRKNANVNAIKIEENGNDDEESSDNVDSSYTSPPRRGRPRKGQRQTKSNKKYSDFIMEDDFKKPKKSKHSAVMTGDMKALLTFLQRKEDQQQKIRQQEIDLRKEEIDLLKKEMQLQKQRFEMDRTERKALLDFLHAQTRSFEMNTAAAMKPGPEMTAEPAGQLTEYTIVVNNSRSMENP